MFSNLIGNAIKYSPPKSVINITIQKQKNKYLFSIENNGTHIPEEAVPKLFEAFYRVDTSRSRQTGGSGLGLYIVQKYYSSIIAVAASVIRKMVLIFSLNFHKADAYENLIGINAASCKKLAAFL